MRLSSDISCWLNKNRYATPSTVIRFIDDGVKPAIGPYEDEEFEQTQ